MAFTDLPAQYVFLFYLTVVLLAVKVVVITIIINRIVTERRKPEKVPIIFLYTMLALMVSLFASRLFYAFFDFFATGFDMQLYTRPGNILLHKTGQVLVNTGLAIMVWVADRRIMPDKFKGVPAIILFLGVVVQAFFPIRDGFVEDFELYSFVGIFFTLPALLILFIFLWMGIVAPKLRKVAWTISIAFAIFTVAAFIVNAWVVSPIEQAFGPWVPYAIYTIAISSKVAGLLMMLYGALKYMQLNSAMVDYYQSKRICVVHKGTIKGRVFMCGNCRIFYCIDCKNAIVRTENKCWNCGDILERSLLIDFSIKTDDPLYQAYLKLKAELKQETDAGTLELLVRVGSELMALDASGMLPATIKHLIEHQVTTTRAREQDLQASTDPVLIGGSETAARARTDARNAPAASQSVPKKAPPGEKNKLQ